MYQINHWLFQFVRWTVLLFSIACLLFSTYLLFAIAFNLPVTFKPGKSRWTTSLADYHLGIPVKAKLFISIPHTSVSLSYNIPGQHSYFAKAPLDNPLFKKDEIVSVYTDTIRAKFHQNEQYDNSIQPLNIAAVQLNEGTVFVRPRNFTQKLAFGLSPILKVMMMGLIGLQLFRLLTLIEKRKFFEGPHYRIVASIGWILIGYNASVFILERMQRSSDQVYTTFDSTIANYRLPFQLSGTLQSSVSLQMLIVAIVVLAFARAFQKGYYLQKDQHLTV